MLFMGHDLLRRCSNGDRSGRWQNQPVGNSFGTDHAPDAPEVNLSNGGTDVFFDVLTLAGCQLATTAWPQNLVLSFADGHRIGRGSSGFDLVDLPWTSDWQQEKAFFLDVLRLAAGRHGWDRLAYDPPRAVDDVVRYGELLTQFTPRPVAAEEEDWLIPPSPELLVRCPRHDVYVGQFGCRLCDRRIQPGP
jgi:hypothetical protein